MNTQTQDYMGDLLRPLPLKAPLYPDETTRSYLRRLETANSLRPGLLHKTLKKLRWPWAQVLSEWTEHPPEVLCLAMPQLVNGTGSPQIRPKLVGRPDRTIRSVACRSCALIRGVSRYVEVFTTHERVLCSRHELWLGDGVHGFSDQLCIHACPDITAAWRHHRNLITRFGHTRIRKAHHISSVINWHWYDQFHHFSTTVDNYDQLAADQPKQANSQATVAAALYPAIVTLSAAIASPYWAKIAHSRRRNLVLDRVSNEITDGWIPQGAGDPLCGWMLSNWSPAFHGSDTIGTAKSKDPGIKELGCANGPRTDP